MIHLFYNRSHIVLQRKSNIDITYPVTQVETRIGAGLSPGLKCLLSIQLKQAMGNQRVNLF